MQQHTIQPCSRTIPMQQKKRVLARLCSEVNIHSDLKVSAPSEGGRDKQFRNYDVTMQDGSKLTLEMTNVLFPDDPRELAKFGKGKTMVGIQAQNEEQLAWHEELSNFLTTHFDSVLPQSVKVHNYIFKNGKLDARLPTAKGHECSIRRRDGRQGSIRDIVAGTPADIMVRLDGFWCSVPTEDGAPAKASANWELVGIRIIGAQQAEQGVEYMFRDEANKAPDTGSAASSSSSGGGRGGASSSKPSTASSSAPARSAPVDGDAADGKPTGGRKPAKRQRTAGPDDDQDDEHAPPEDE